MDVPPTPNFSGMSAAQISMLSRAGFTVAQIADFAGASQSPVAWRCTKMTRQKLSRRRSRAIMLPRRRAQLSPSLQKPPIPGSSKTFAATCSAAVAGRAFSPSSEIPAGQASQSSDVQLHTCIDSETIQLLLFIWALRRRRVKHSAARLWTSHIAIHNIESRAWIRANVSKESRKPRLKRYAAAHQDMPGTNARYGFSCNLKASCGSPVNNPRWGSGTGKSLVWVSMIEARQSQLYLGD